MGDATQVLNDLTPAQTTSDLFGQFGQAGQSALDAFKDTANGLPKWLGGTEQPVPMEGAAGSAGMGFLGGLGMLSGGIATAKGIDEMANGKVGQGAFDTASGLASFTQGATSALTPMLEAGSQAATVAGNVGGVAGVIGGGLQLGKGVSELGTDGAQATFDLMQGGLNTTAGIATLAGAAPVAAVAGAGALGMTVGNLMAQAADSDATKTGFWGKNEDTGKNQSAMDWGASWGTDYDKAHNNGEASITGGVLAGLGGIVGGVGGAGQALWNWATN